MIENILLDDKCLYLFIDIENVGYIDIPSYVLNKYNVIAVSSKCKSNLVKYKEKYPSVNVVYLNCNGKQVSDFYIYRNAVQLKITKPNSIITVISNDVGYSVFSGLYGDIDFIFSDINDIVSLDASIVSINNPVIYSDNDYFDLLYSYVESYPNLIDERKYNIIKLINLHRDYLDNDLLYISMKDFKNTKSLLDNIKVSKLKGKLYLYFSTYKEYLENEYKFISKDILHSLIK